MGWSGDGVRWSDTGVCGVRWSGDGVRWSGDGVV